MADESKHNKPRTTWSPVVPVPDGTPPARVRHSNRGEPQRVFIYRSAADELLGYVCRFIASSGEPLHLSLTWCQGNDGTFAWRWIQFPRLRPLYGLDELARRPNDPVLVVFDEHAAAWARELLPGFVTVSWPGGVRNIDEVDWSVLRGRMGWVWPDLTRRRMKLGPDAEPGGVLPRERQPGWAAAAKIERILRGYGCAMALIDPFCDASLPEGWNVGTAAFQGWTGEQALDWFVQHLHAEDPAELARSKGLARGEGGASAQEPERPPNNEWVSSLIWKHGELVSCVANVHDVLMNSPHWRGVVAFDEFAQRTLKLKAPPFAGGEVGEWDATDDTRTAMWLARQFGFTPSSAMVAEAVEVCARAASFHPVRQWLRGLKWDATPRIDHWLCDFLGVPESDYAKRVARYFLIGMVARVMQPGVKFDYCLVLEGKQGKGKSSALRILGGEWFGDTDMDLQNKDSMSALRGKWLYEFSELGSLTKSESYKQKSFLSRQVDEFRPVYGRREIRCPRQVVFSGSTNDWEWNKDPTGGRRFWPVECADAINLEGLAEVREQLFAEALVLYEQREKFYPSAEEQQKLFDPEQLKREQQESLVDALHDWVYEQIREFSIADAILSGLKMDASKLTRDLQTRVGISLRKLGCARVERRNGMIRYWYKPPEKKAARSMAGDAQRVDGGDHVSF